MERRTTKKKMTKLLRFNPCYVGSKMESSIKQNINTPTLVSILVMLEVKWKEITMFNLSGFCISFQSLLCWK